MKKYIKPSLMLNKGITAESFLATATTNHGGFIDKGGGTAEGGITTGGVKGRDGYVDEEEDDPILHLIIDQEEGNTSSLW